MSAEVVRTEFRNYIGSQIRAQLIVRSSRWFRLRCTCPWPLDGRSVTAVDMPRDERARLNLLPELVCDFMLHLRGGCVRMSGKT